MGKISALLMAAAILAPLTARAADWSDNVDVAGLSRTAQSQHSRRQQPQAAAAPADTAEAALPEPYAGIAFEGWKSDYKDAFAELRKTCVESGNDASLVGQPFKFRDAATKQDVAIQVCAPQGKQVLRGRAYVLLFGSADVAASDGAAKSLKALCATQGAEASIVGEWYNFTQARTAVSVGICRYRLPK